MPEFILSGHVAMVKGQDVAQMLVSGQIDAAIGVPASASPDLRPLISDPAAAEAQWFRSTGIYPMNHTVVIRTRCCRSGPILPARFLDRSGRRKRST